MLNPDGSEVDWIVGYGPPPEKYQETVDRSLNGVETFQFYSDSYAEDPYNVGTVFHLGMKWSRRYQRDKAADFFRRVLELDPDGSEGTTEYQGEEVSFTQYADFNLAADALRARPPDPADLLAFVEKYPEGILVRAGYDRLSSSYFLRAASKERAAEFFEKFASRYPEDPRVLGSWIQRINRDLGPFDTGAELGQRALALMADDPQPRLVLDIARLHVLKGDNEKAVELAEMAVKHDGATSTAVSSAASIFMRAEATDKAIAAYGPDFAKNNWGSAAVLNRYASFWSREPELNGTSALAAAIRAVGLSPDSYSYWNTLSDVFVAQKRFDEALLAARKSLEIAPEGRAKEFVERKIEQIKRISEKK
jgi:tetratricopeptide (TPR) repeat protein